MCTTMHGTAIPDDLVKRCDHHMLIGSGFGSEPAGTRRFASRKDDSRSLFLVIKCLGASVSDEAFGDTASRHDLR